MIKETYGSWCTEIMDSVPALLLMFTIIGLNSYPREVSFQALNWRMPWQAFRFAEIQLWQMYSSIENPSKNSVSDVKIDYGESRVLERRGIVVMLKNRR